MWIGPGCSWLTTPPSNEHGLVIDTKRERANDIPRHRVHLVVDEDVVIESSGSCEDRKRRMLISGIEIECVWRLSVGVMSGRHLIGAGLGVMGLVALRPC